MRLRLLERSPDPRKPEVATRKAAVAVRHNKEAVGCNTFEDTLAEVVVDMDSGKDSGTGSDKDSGSDSRN